MMKADTAVASEQSKKVQKNVRIKDIEDFQADNKEKAIEYAKSRYRDKEYQIDPAATLSKKLSDFGEVAFVAYKPSTGHRDVVIVIDQGKIYVPRWNDIQATADKDYGEPYPDIVTLRQIPWKAHWLKRHPDKAWKILAGMTVVLVPIATLLISAHNSFKFSSSSSEKPASAKVASDNSTAGSSTSGNAGGTKSIQANATVADTAKPAAVAPAASASTTSPLKTVSPAQASAAPPQSLEQYLNSYLLAQIGASLSAQHYQGAYLKFSDAPRTSYDSGSASCAIDGSIDYSGGSILPDATGKLAWSSAGDTEDQTIENACKLSVDDMIDRYRHL